MRESQVERHLVKCVRALDGLCLKFKVPGRRGAEDRLCLLPRARVYFIETKAPRKKAKAHQAREHARKRALGFTVLVLDTLAKVNDWYFDRLEEDRGWRSA